MYAETKTYVELVLELLHSDGSEMRLDEFINFIDGQLCVDLEDLIQSRVVIDNWLHCRNIRC